MNIIIYLSIAIQCLIGFHLFFPLILGLFSWVRMLGKHGGINPLVDNLHTYEADYAVIVTAYEETGQIPHVVDSILKLNYSNYLIYVVADKCDIADLSFESEKVVLLRPESVLASNIKSHFYAIEHFLRDHERITIIDSDNLVHADYLVELNDCFDRGYTAVQGVRKAKNLNTTFACLDEAGDIYYRYIDRKLLFYAGSSASLAGSGMAFTIQLYKDCLRNAASNGAGFDKFLQYKIVSNDLQIAFSERAVVFDEKTSKPDQLVKQRARWINTWFRYFILGFNLLFKGLRNFSFNQIAFGVMLLRPPLFVILFVAVAGLLINIIMMPGMALFWLLALSGMTFTLFRSLTYFKTDKQIYNALLKAPAFLFYQLFALFKARNANKYSVATKHDQQAGIDEFK